MLEEVPDPVAGPDDVLVRLRASALNHLDVWVRKGLPSVPKPRILGADGAGVVEALGEHVDGFALGDREDDRSESNRRDPALDRAARDHRRASNLASDHSACSRRSSSPPFA